MRFGLLESQGQEGARNAPLQSAAASGCLAECEQGLGGVSMPSATSPPSVSPKLPERQSFLL